MLHTTRGVVLHTTRYSDTARIARVYTELFGIQSYLVRIGSKKNRGEAALFQPLSLLELVVQHKNTRAIQRATEVRSLQPFSSIPLHPHKRAVVLFLKEVLYKTLREEEANPGLFNFIYGSVVKFDGQEDGENDFHLLFLTQLAGYLGFAPGGTYSDASPFFNLKDGSFCAQPPEHSHYIAPPLSELFSLFLSGIVPLQRTPATSERRILLEKLLEYYSFHIEEFGEMHSHEVLGQVMRA